MSYRLTKQHFFYGAGNTHMPVLIGDRDSGPYDQNAVLPFSNNSTASGFVWRHLLGEQLASDPALACDDGADLHAYAWEFLTWRTPREVFEFAEMFHRLKTRKIKIPQQLV